MLNTLYHKGKNGELRQWRTWAEGDTICTEYGVVDGALQTSRKKCTPKNVGKKNATTPEEQALAEVQALYTFKLERKYSASPEEAQMPLLLPMLAGKYDAKKHKGCYLGQPKLDGVRCIARWEGDSVVLYSRQGKVYDVKHISDELSTFMGKDDVFDGELYIHGMPLQSIISLVKKPQDRSDKIKYWVYDMPVVDGDDDLPFKDRHASIDKVFGDYYEKYFSKMTSEEVLDWEPETDDNVSIVEVGTYWCDDVEFYLKQFLSEGYEGLMLREPNSKYLWGYRSNDLLKVKIFQDSEFLVVDIIEGEGKMEGHAVVICQNDLTDATFKVAPKATMETRKEIYDNKSDYIGRKYTVKYFDRTEDSIPRFPVGLAFREDV
jgi:DNA ligase-1